MRSRKRETRRNREREKVRWLETRKRTREKKRSRGWITDGRTTSSRLTVEGLPVEASSVTRLVGLFSRIATVGGKATASGRVPRSLQAELLRLTPSSTRRESSFPFEPATHPSHPSVAEDSSSLKPPLIRRDAEHRSFLLEFFQTGKLSPFLGSVPLSVFPYPPESVSVYRVDVHACIYACLDTHCCWKKVEKMKGLIVSSRESDFLGDNRGSYMKPNRTADDN